MNCILLMGERYKKWFGQIKLRSISPTCQGWLGPTAKWINTTMIINIGNLSNKHPLPNGYHYHKEHYCEPHYLHQQYHLHLFLAVVLYSWYSHFHKYFHQDMNKSESRYEKIWGVFLWRFDWWLHLGVELSLWMSRAHLRICPATSLLLKPFQLSF